MDSLLDYMIHNRPLTNNYEDTLQLHVLACMHTSEKMASVAGHTWVLSRLSLHWTWAKHSSCNAAFSDLTAFCSSCMKGE